MPTVIASSPTSPDDKPTPPTSDPSLNLGTARGKLPAILWGCYLGCSWTWVIGMLLPTFLVRDYGLWGWIVFAIPNVIGAGALGFVISKAEVSRRLVLQHQLAFVGFTLCTVAYQFFGAAWIGGQLVGVIIDLPFGYEIPPKLNIWVPFLAVLAAGPILYFFRKWLCKKHPAAILAFAVWLVSLGLFGWFLFNHATTEPFKGLQLTPIPSENSRLSLIDLLIFIPASITGFLLCPYLDITFHKARQVTTPSTGRWAFGLGFGIVFFSMIIFSLAYADENQLLKHLVVNNKDDVTLATFRTIIALQLGLQTGFTVLVHLWATKESFGKPVAGVTAILAIVLGLTAAYITTGIPPRLHGLASHEVIYRCFLLFYGMVFPSYVWLIMIPYRQPINKQTALIIFALATILAYACGYHGFIVADPGQSYALFASMLIIGAARPAIMLLAKAPTPKQPSATR